MRNLPLVLLAAFAIADIAANWRVLGMRSVSEQVWSLSWPMRVATGIVLIAIASHLALKWPYGPGA